MQRQPGAIAQLLSMANKCQHPVPAALVHGAEATSPTCLCVLGECPYLGSYGPEDRDPQILHVLIYEYPELAYLCELPAAGLTLLLDWVGGAGG